MLIKLTPGRAGAGVGLTKGGGVGGWPFPKLS
jgi:hypothetical protein